MVGVTCARVAGLGGCDHNPEAWRGNRAVYWVKRRDLVQGAAALRQVVVLLGRYPTARGLGPDAAVVG